MPSNNRQLKHAEDAAMRAYYRRGLEFERLDTPQGVIEFERSREILARTLPPPPAVIADIGGGPGRYARWLSHLGYTVEHRDIFPPHVEQVAAMDAPGIHTAVGDARALDLADAAADAVLLLGPLYHLRRHHDRVDALLEARRIVRPGGYVFVAAISRWARLHVILAERYYDDLPNALTGIEQSRQNGELLALAEGDFTGYSHTPDELRNEITRADLSLVDLVGIEGTPMSTNELARRLADPVERRALFDAARAIERVPELLGMSLHLLATCTR